MPVAMGRKDCVEGLKGLDVYTQDGIFVGVVSEVVMNVLDMRIESIYIAEVNPALADESVCITVPYRWIAAIGDIVLLSRFPAKRISASRT